MERLFNCSANRKTDPHRQCPSTPLSLFLSLAFPFPFCFSLSIFMYGPRQFHITCVPTAVWVSACVCLCLCSSLCYFLMSTSLWTTSEQVSTNPVTAEPCSNSSTTAKAHSDPRFRKCYILQWAVTLITALLAWMKTSFTHYFLEYLDHSATCELFHYYAANYNTNTCTY